MLEEINKVCFFHPLDLDLHLCYCWVAHCWWSHHGIAPEKIWSRGGYCSLWLRLRKQASPGSSFHQMSVTPHAWTLAWLPISLISVPLSHQFYPCSRYLLVPGNLWLTLSPDCQKQIWHLDFSLLKALALVASAFLRESEGCCFRKPVNQSPLAVSLSVQACGNWRSCATANSYASFLTSVGD